MKESLKVRAEKIRYLWNIRGKPWVKKNRIPIMISLAALAVILIFVIRGASKADRIRGDRQVKTEKTADGITGADVKKQLLAWKPGDNYAIVVAEGAQLAYHKKDTFYKNRYSLLFVDEENEILNSVETNTGQHLTLWGINYGNVIYENAIYMEGDTGYSQYGLLKKDYKDNKLNEDTGKTKKVVVKKKTNPYTLEKGIKIPDDEYFEKVTIADQSGREIGCLYRPSKIILPQQQR